MSGRLEVLDDDGTGAFKLLLGAGVERGRAGDEGRRADRGAGSITAVVGGSIPGLGGGRL